MKRNGRPQADGDTGRPSRESGFARGFMNTLNDAGWSARPRFAPRVPRGGGHGG
jgi:hypothetical protein